MSDRFYCASCHEEFATLDGMYRTEEGDILHDEEGGMSACGPVLDRLTGLAPTDEPRASVKE